jgi:Mrp family chromosome partitioning ATPase
MAVSDSEILARFVDVCLLVISANTTEIDWLQESVNLLQHEGIYFAGSILNNFNFRSGYHSYYRYYDHYSEDYKGSKKKNLEKK